MLHTVLSMMPALFVLRASTSTVRLSSLNVTSLSYLHGLSSTPAPAEHQDLQASFHLQHPWHAAGFNQARQSSQNGRQGASQTFGEKFLSSSTLPDTVEPTCHCQYASKENYWLGISFPQVSWPSAMVTLAPTAAVYILIGNQVW
jgi:hypothetical protein